MQHIEKCTFLKLDFTKEDAPKKILATLKAAKREKVNVVLR